MLRKVLVAVSLAVVVALAATFSAGATGTLDQSAAPGSDSIRIEAGQFGGFSAQTFTAGLNGFLDHVDLYLSEFNNPPGDLIVEIQTTVNGSPSGTVIGRGSVSASDVPPSGQPGWVSIPLKAVLRRIVLPAVTPFSGVHSVAGEQYAIVVSSPESNCANGGIEGSGCWYSWNMADGDTYSGGSAGFKGLSATSWNMDPRFDFAFRTYVQSRPRAIGFIG